MTLCGTLANVSDSDSHQAFISDTITCIYLKSPYLKVSISKNECNKCSRSSKIVRNQSKYNGFSQNRGFKNLIPVVKVEIQLNQRNSYYRIPSISDLKVFVIDSLEKN